VFNSEFDFQFASLGSNVLGTLDGTLFVCPFFSKSNSLAFFDVCLVSGILRRTVSLFRLVLLNDLATEVGLFDVDAAKVIFIKEVYFLIAATDVLREDIKLVLIDERSRG